VAKKCSAAPTAVSALAGVLNASTMRRLNYEIDDRKRAPADVAKEFLSTLRP
jgi:glycine betaine/choline ABC-type transport system substrate-binding protein